MERFLEAYVGEYASGKSEVAINRALDLKTQGREVTLVDFDLVEPFYTLRPLKRKLEEKGIQVLAWNREESMGLGETGNLIKREARWVLKRPGDIILDIGYGVEGSKTLNLLEEKEKYPQLKIYAVINIGRPLTNTVKKIVDYIKSLGIIHGLINNSHLGRETDIAFVQKGAELVTRAGKILKLPIMCSYVQQSLKEVIGEYDRQGNPVRILHRYMEEAFW